MENLKKLGSEASSFFNRAKQFTGEKLGGAEKTIYNVEMEILIRRSDATKSITERIISSTNSVLQPNPNERIEDFVLTKLDRRISKPNNLELLGQTLVESGNELGSNFQYGNILTKVGEAEKKLGLAEKDFVQKSSDNLLQPLKSFLDGQMKTIQKEKKTLEIKRLDLDSCKGKIRKLSENMASKQENQVLIVKAEEELRRAQADFDRQSELTKLLMDELEVSYNHHLQCLNDFIEAQLNYYNNGSKILQELSKQIGGSSGIPKSVINTTNNSNLNTQLSNFGPNAIGAGLAPNFTNVKKAKVLFDYEATDPSEISVSANQIINVQIVPNDNDWVLAESGNDSGKVPKAYIQIVE